MVKVKECLKQSDAKLRLIIIGIIGALIVIWTASQIMRRSYLCYANVMTILLSTGVNGRMALGVAWTIMTAGIVMSSRLNSVQPALGPG